MNKENPTTLPTIELDVYDDFIEVAMEAAIVTFKPDFFYSPFLDDEKRLRRVVLHAIGVRRHGSALTFKYTFDYDCIYDSSKSWDEQVKDASQFLSQLIASLKSVSNLVQGNVSSEYSVGESLASL